MGLQVVEYLARELGTCRLRSLMCQVVAVFLSFQHPYCGTAC